MTQLQEIAYYLKHLDNGADAALILAVEKTQQELLHTIQNLKACVLSMTPTDFTNEEFYQKTLEEANQLISKCIEKEYDN